MAMSPTYALAHVFMPNLLKLKGGATVVGVIERKEKFFFDILWSQAHIEHAPFLMAHVVAPYRIGVVSLPPPQEMGEAYYVAIAVKSDDPMIARYFTLEHDYVLATKADRTLVCERVGPRHVKHVEGPAITGNPDVDAMGFISAVSELLVPTKLPPRPERPW